MNIGTTGCKVAPTIVAYTTGLSPNEVAGWSSSCIGTFNETTAATPATLWPLIVDDHNSKATSYGAATGGQPRFRASSTRRLSQAMSRSCPRTPPGMAGPTDIVLTVSNDGGKTFPNAPTQINQGESSSSPSVDRPFAVADPGVTDGTFYVAWSDENLQSIRFRKGQVDATTGAVTLFPTSTVSGAPTFIDAFTMSVEHATPVDTVHIAFSDADFGHATGTCEMGAQSITWTRGATSDDGNSWEYAPIDSDTSFPRCAPFAPGGDNDSYGISTRPEMIFSPALGTFHVAYSKRTIAAAPASSPPTSSRSPQTAAVVMAWRSTPRTSRIPSVSGSLCLLCNAERDHPIRHRLLCG